MKKSIFKKDLDNAKVYVTREFAGTVEMVWKAWTTPELLEQWWAPKPYKAITVKMDFREGGRWFYYMQGPEAGERHYCLADYKKIVPQKSYDVRDAFCDEAENVNKDFPSTEWSVSFSPTPEGTIVDMVLTYASVEDMKKIMELGFEEGFTMAHSNLDELLAKK